MMPMCAMARSRVIFRDFPIVELHPNAPAAHIASLCVAEQGAVPYWEMHDQLFRTQSEWGNATDPAPVFERLAAEAGADVAAFKTCLEQTDAKQALIDTALAEGQAAGVSGTPSFQFVSGAGDKYLLVGAQPFEQFAAYSDALVAGEAPPVAQEEQQPQGEAQIPFWATAEGLKPDPDRPGYTMAGDAYRGSADAKVTVIEFSDFQCPFCQRHVEETQPALDCPVCGQRRNQVGVQTLPALHSSPSARCRHSRRMRWRTRQVLGDA